MAPAGTLSPQGGTRAPTPAPTDRRPLGWNNIDRVKFCCLCPTLLLGAKALFYPPDLIKTRLQVQASASAAAALRPGRPAPFDFKYKGPCDAARRIVRAEGVRGLFRGFGVSNLGVVVMQLYITVFEATSATLAARAGLHRMDSEVGQLVVSSTSGAVAAAAAQLLGTPCRVLLQHIQCGAATVPSARAVGAAATPALGVVVAAAGAAPAEGVVGVARAVAARHGVGHFWRGFSGSVLMYAPTSAIWWLLYPSINQRLVPAAAFAFGGGAGDTAAAADASSSSSLLQTVLVKALAGSLAAGVTCVATNPLDVVRTRHNLLAQQQSPPPPQQPHRALPVVGGRGRRRQPWLLGRGTRGGLTAAAVLRDLLREDGVAGLYRGLSVRAVKFCLSSFVMVVIYESVKERCRLPASSY